MIHNSVWIESFTIENRERASSKDATFIPLNNPEMNITLVGSGNAATVLGRKCLAAGHAVHQVLSRNEQAASNLASLLCSVTSGPLQQAILPNTDLILLTVPDHAIESTAAQLTVNDSAILLHVAGSVSIHVLRNYAKAYGVLYPLQTLRKEEIQAIPDIPLLIEANESGVLERVLAFAHSISNQVLEASEEERRNMHLAAVWINNFTNHMAAISRQFCKENELDFSILYPLLQETTRKILLGNPAEHQTGPAIRGDQTTLERHLSLLHQHPNWQELYRMLSHSIASFNDKASQSA
jgi:predicted short-subunit dehydrogenase-like oxidoreductase (DUF2520 family)